MTCLSLAAHVAEEMRGKPRALLSSCVPLALRRAVPGLSDPAYWKLAGLALRYWERPERFS